jgi:AraC-like DNA-binding protein
MDEITAPERPGQHDDACAASIRTIAQPRILGVELSERTWSIGRSEVEEPVGEHRLLIVRGLLGRHLELTGIGAAGRLSAHPAHVAFLPAGTSWICMTDGETLNGVSVSLPVQLVEIACGMSTSSWRAAIDERQPRISDTIGWLSRHADRPADFCIRPIELLLARLSAATFGRFARGVDDAWLPAAALARTSSFVETNLSERLTLSLMAASAGLSVSAFSRGFRGSTGLTPIEYLIERRMARVARSLVGTRMTLVEIAAAVGLSSAPHLSQQFRAYFGITITEYRARRTTCR